MLETAVTGVLVAGFGTLLYRAKRIGEHRFRAIERTWKENFEAVVDDNGMRISDIKMIDENQLKKKVKQWS